jgi:MSHA biogenesis protein MshJ
MKQYWEKFQTKIDAMSLRERGMVFAAIIVALIALANFFFLDPLLTKQKSLTAQMVQQQEKIKETHALMEVLVDARKNGENSPLRKQLSLAKQKIDESERYLQNLRNGLVAPEKMPDLLQQVLKKEGQLELVSLQSLPVTPLITGKPETAKVASTEEADGQVYMHPVKITVRGSYLELVQYLTNLEHLPMQMFWGAASLKVVQQPTAELTLTLYTLSLDKTWLQI